MILINKQSTKSRNYDRCDDIVDTKNFESIQLEESNEFIRDVPSENSKTSLNKNFALKGFHAETPKTYKIPSKHFNSNSRKIKKKQNNWMSSKIKKNSKLTKQKKSNQPKWK